MISGERSESEAVKQPVDDMSLGVMTAAMGLRTKAAVTTKATATPLSSAKRQRSLVDMFPKSSTPAKRSRLSEPSPSQESDPGMPSSSPPVVTREVILGKTSLNSIPFSLSRFKESLNEEQRELLQLECETVGLSWMKLLSSEITKPYFIKLKQFLRTQGVLDASHRSPKVYPPAKDIYTWSKSPLGRVRVVIIGQDPYHGTGQAHGLCFSVQKGVAIPPSLKNIYTEISTEYPEFEIPKHGYLASWAKSGVLLLNTCLTVEAHKANSHANKGWEQFTEKIIEVACMYGGASFNKAGVGKGIVFMAWGAPAAKRVAKVDKARNLILTSPHPSPLSAHRGFFGNGHFRKANEWLEMRYGEEAKVDWTRLDAN